MAELAVRHFATSLYFKRNSFIDINFDRLVNRFKIMLSVENMSSKRFWFRRARIWRFVFLQSDEGYFDATPGLGFALMADKSRLTAEDVRKKEVKVGDLTTKEVLQLAMGEQYLDKTVLKHADKENTDCPYSGHDWEAIEWSIPKELLLLQRATRGEINALRVWTTCLCSESLMLLDESYLANDDEPNPEETIVDKAYGWLEEQCFACDDLDLILMDVLEDARAFAVSWEVRHEVNAEQSRRADREKNTFRQLLRTNKNAGDLCRTLMVKHETVSTFFGPPNDALLRWQRVMIMGTALLVALTVDVWIFQQNGFNCCVDARVFLGCSESLSEPCRGFSGDCADLLAQFVDLPDVSVQDFKCTRFPREARALRSWSGVVYRATPFSVNLLRRVSGGLSRLGRAAVPPATSSVSSLTLFSHTSRPLLSCPSQDRYLDRVLVGVIMAAIVFPIKLFAERCFEFSNETDMPEAWLQWFGLRRLLFGRVNWRFQDPGVRPKEWKRRASQVGRDPLVVLAYCFSHFFGNIYRKMTCWPGKTKFKRRNELRAQAERTKDTSLRSDEGFTPIKGKMKKARRRRRSPIVISFSVQRSLLFEK